MFNTLVIKKEIPSPVKTEEVEEYVCTICNTIFSTHGSLLEHFLKHGNEIDLQGRPRLKATREPPTVKCEWCPAKFYTYSNAIGHKYKKHTTEANYFCKVCGKLFPIKITLEDHMNREHKNTDNKTQVVDDEIKECVLCKSKFETERALRHHIKNAHQFEQQIMKQTYVPAPSKKVKLNTSGEITSVFYCHLCGSEYMVKYNLKKHILTHEPELRNDIPENFIKCTICEAIFYNKKAYDVHNGNHKPDDLYVACEEQRYRMVSRVDQDFDIRRVPTTVDKVLNKIDAMSAIQPQIKKERRDVDDILQKLE